jgi:hypothetical protein
MKTKKRKISIKKSFLMLASISILLSVLAYSVNNNYRAAVALTVRRNIQEPKVAIYRMFLFGIVPVAEARMSNLGIEAYQGKPVFHFRARAYPLAFYGNFLKAEAVLDSLVSVQSSDPVLFRQELILPGKVPVKKEISYNQSKGIMTVAGVQRLILPHTQDPLSAMFNLRQYPFAQDTDIEISINTNQKNYVLKGKAVQRELTYRNQGYSCVVAETIIKRRDKDNPYHQSNVTFVLLKEFQNLPLYIKVFASGMVITARLVDLQA